MPFYFYLIIYTATINFFNTVSNNKLTENILNDVVLQRTDGAIFNGDKYKNHKKADIPYILKYLNIITDEDIKCLVELIDLLVN